MKQPRDIADGAVIATGPVIADGQVIVNGPVTSDGVASPELHAIHSSHASVSRAADPTREPGFPDGAGDAAAWPVVLILDDDASYRAELARYIRSNGFAVQEPDGFAAALDVVQTAHGTFVIVPDLTVGSRHLFDYLGLFRRAPGTSVLVLSSRREETEKIVALELGADDFISKAADRREILARIRAAARRLPARRSVALPVDAGCAQAPTGAVGTWRFLRVKRELIDPEGRRVRLTTAEFALLEAFVADAGRPLNRDYLSMAALGRPHHATDRGIDNLVAKLRRKLGDSARLASMIKTARPIGYVFTGFSSTETDVDPGAGERQNGLEHRAETTVPSQGSR